MTEQKESTVNINTFVWKGNKELDSNGKYKQVEKKMNTMNYAELIACYDHCKTMLFNKDFQNPGRYLVLDIINEQKNKIGSELFLRHVEENNGLTRFTLTGAINKFIENNKEALKTVKANIEQVFSSIPNQFEKLPLNLILDGCLDRLGTFNKKHVTKTFILKQGIWLTPTESKELREYDEDGNFRDRIEIIKEKLNLRENDQLYINSKGLNYTQLRAMLNIRPDKKYKDLTTIQLETLRYRVLFTLEESVRTHITSWENRMSELEMVAEFKGFKL